MPKFLNDFYQLRCTFKNLKGKCILDWTEDDVQNWLQNGFQQHVDLFAEHTGEDIANLRKSDMSQLSISTPVVNRLFNRVSNLLHAQNREKHLTDGQLNDIMATRGKQRFVGFQIYTNLEHVKRNLIVFFCQFFLSNFGWNGISQEHQCNQVHAILI